MREIWSFTIFKNSWVFSIWSRFPMGLVCSCLSPFSRGPLWPFFTLENQFQCSLRRTTMWALFVTVIFFFSLEHYRQKMGDLGHQKRQQVNKGFEVESFIKISKLVLGIYIYIYIGPLLSPLVGNGWSKVDLPLISKLTQVKPVWWGQLSCLRWSLVSVCV